MTPLPPDQSRDRRIEDPTNLWIIHPAGRRLLPWFVACGVSANAVSVGGLVLGILAALAYSNWTAWPWAITGLLMSIAWLIADGLDGMIARATGTASLLGRVLDGLCDHGVFVLIYIVLAASIDTFEGWALAISAGIAHAVQSSLYEGERARFHRRCRGEGAPPLAHSRNPLVQLYDCVAGLVDRIASPFDQALRRQRDPSLLAAAYGIAAARPMRLMSLLSANVRVYAIFLACVANDPRLFWWFELVPLTAILLIGLAWHRAIEFRVAGTAIEPISPSDSSSTRRT
ncbi:CDP-alcohol phosphatidyltransferase family protein [Sphingomonas sp.]|uniref:CDP-alcohol phosphatidyltransferase family protein n=1 Tax=Sphingomonas sp. TaxID=28214 RepID=UPI002ED838D6